MEDKAENLPRLKAELEKKRVKLTELHAQGMKEGKTGYDAAPEAWREYRSLRARVIALEEREKSP